MTSLDLVEQILASHSCSDGSYELFQEHTTIKDLLRQEMMRKGLLLRQRDKNSLQDSPSPPLQPDVSRESLPALLCSSSEEDSPCQRPVAVISPMLRRAAFTEVRFVYAHKFRAMVSCKFRWYHTKIIHAYLLRVEGVPRSIICDIEHCAIDRCLHIKSVLFPSV